MLTIEDHITQLKQDFNRCAQIPYANIGGVVLCLPTWDEMIRRHELLSKKEKREKDISISILEWI